MPLYEYTARTTIGEPRDGRLVIANEKALSEYLSAQGLILTNAKLIDEKKKGLSAFFRLTGHVPIVQKIFFTQNLQVMVRTGFSLGNALHTLGLQTENKSFKQVIMEMEHDVDSGKTFSDALKKHSDIFPEMFINMIAAGEVSGKLDEVLHQLTLQMKKDHTLITKVKSALSYPIIVVSAMVGLVIAMMLFVIPKLLGVFAESGVALPLPTQILISVTNFTSQNGLWVIIGLFALTIGVFRLIKTQKGKFYYHRILLRLPIVGKIIKKINLARFTRSLSSLLKTDIPIVQTLQIISRTLGNVHYQNVMMIASEEVKKGISIVKTLERFPQLFPPIVTQMVHVGEQSGTLDTIVEEIANFYEEEVDTTMANLSTIIEPALMLILGAGVAGLAVAIILPIYNLSQAI
ncbi:MAG: type II secretion system F family protein [Patescibacteria group bacterium]|jgi:type IV pilus assembly protein PilC